MGIGQCAVNQAMTHKKRSGYPESFQAVSPAGG
jgi:hypothetical protein